MTEAAINSLRRNATEDRRGESHDEFVLGVESGGLAAVVVDGGMSRRLGVPQETTHPTEHPKQFNGLAWTGFHDMTREQQDRCLEIVGYERCAQGFFDPSQLEAA